MPETPILGLVRKDPDDPYTWEPFTDEKTALHAEIDDVIFGETMADCIGQLEAKYPASDHRLSRVRSMSDGGYDGRGQWNSKKLVIVRPENQQEYSGGDHLEALALVKELGEISCRELRTGYGYHGDQVDWQQEGVVVTPSGGYYGHITHLKYNPKGVARALKAAETRKKNRPVTCGDVSHCTWALRNLVRKHIPSLSYESPDGRYSRYSVAWIFLETMKYFAFVFGKHAWRKHPKFRELKMKWRAKETQTRKAFYDACDYGDVIRRFCNFMDAECQIRNGRLIEKDTNWKPRGEFPDFKEFNPSRYEKIYNRRKRAEEEARKAKEKAKAATAKKRRPAAKQRSTRQRRVARNGSHGNV